MMNEAAMNCLQGQVPSSQFTDSHGAGYHLQMNRPCEPNFHPHHSKAQTDHILIDGSLQYLQQMPTIGSPRPDTGEVRDPRPQVRCIQTRKSLDLPVPQFEVDGNCVSDHSGMTNQNIDLDTRIDLLIKSNVLAGMNPIFSELVESEDSHDSRPYRSKLKKYTKRSNSLSPPLRPFIQEDDFDDPDKPLSRPPSPFLSRATYLFWFNKAIELKEQAKAQEQALIEQATKRLQNNLVSTHTDPVKQSDRRDDTVFRCVLNEVSKELQETIKKQFISEIIENFITKSLEQHWCETDHVISISDDENKTSLDNKLLHAGELVKTSESSHSDLIDCGGVRSKLIINTVEQVNEPNKSILNQNSSNSTDSVNSLIAQAKKAVPQDSQNLDQ